MPSVRARIVFCQPQFDRATFPELPCQPVLQIGLQGTKLDARTGFEHAVGYWQSIVEGGASGEVPHAKAVKPGGGTVARPLRTRRLEDLDVNLARKHDWLFGRSAPQEPKPTALRPGFL